MTHTPMTHNSTIAGRAPTTAHTPSAKVVTFRDDTSTGLRWEAAASSPVLRMDERGTLGVYEAAQVAKRLSRLGYVVVVNGDHPGADAIRDSA